MSRSQLIRKPTACGLCGCEQALGARRPRWRRDVGKRQPPAAESAETTLDFSHLRRETRTALELAVIALAPSDLIDSLAWVAGLLEAIIELPPKSAPVVALIPKVSKRARSALEDWNAWQAAHLAKPKA